MWIGFAWAKQQPKHDHKAADSDSSGPKDDNEIPNDRSDHVMIHDALFLLALGALGSDVLCCHWLAMVAPGTTLVIYDIGNVDIAKLAVKRRHHTVVLDVADSGTLQTEKDGMDVLARIRIIDHSVPLERRERAWQTLTCGLMADGAIGGEQLLALASIVAAGDRSV